MVLRFALALALLAVAHGSAPIRAPPGLGLSPAPVLKTVTKPFGAVLGTLGAVFPNVSHTGSEMNFGVGLAFAGPPLMLRGARIGASMCRMSSRTLSRDDGNPVTDALKRAWIGFERVMVTITQGTEMAEAAVTLEEDRLFGSRRLARAKKVVDSMLTNAFQKEKTANLEDCYSSTAFEFEASQHLDKPHKVRPRREHAPPVSNKAHPVSSADLSDCYSKGVFSGAEDEIELSAGYREGDDDDLPLLKDLAKTHPTGKDARYGGDNLHKQYAESAFKD